MFRNGVVCLFFLFGISYAQHPPARGPPGGVDDSCPSTVGRAPLNLPKLGQNWANLMVNNRFPCDGKIIAWEYYRGYAGSEAFVSVWRPTAARQVYTLIGKTKLTRDSIGKHLVDISSSPINVKEGDFIGIHYSKNTKDAAVSNALGNDLPANEMHDTVNAGVFDESMTTGHDVDFSIWYSVKRTYSIRAIMGDTGSTTEPATGSCKSGDCPPSNSGAPGFVP